MSSKLLKLLSDLNEFNKISDNLSSIQEVLTSSVKSKLNLDLINNSIIGDIKLCRSDLKILNTEKPKLINTNVIQFKCKKCNKQFRLWSQLLNHKSIDLNKRKYKCNKCDECFKNLSVLKNHHLIHSTEKTMYAIGVNAENNSILIWVSINT